MSQSENPITIRVEVCGSGVTQVNQEKKKCGCGCECCSGTYGNEPNNKAITLTSQLRVTSVTPVDKPAGPLRVRIAGYTPKFEGCNTYPNRIKCKIYQHASNVPDPTDPPAADAVIITPLTGVGGANPGHYDNWDGFYSFRAMPIPCGWSPAWVYIVIWAEWDNCNGVTKQLQCVHMFYLDCDNQP